MHNSGICPSSVSSVIGNNPSRRIEIILWALTYQYDPDPNKKTKWPGNFNQMTDHVLTQNPYLALNIKEQISNLALIDDSFFKWINNSRRQNFWILNNFNILLESAFISIPARDRIIANIDLRPTTKNEKEVFIEDLEMRWRVASENPKFDWFKDDKNKSKLAWEWLRKNSELKLETTPPFENHEDLLIYFDRIGPESFLLPVDEYLRKIKARWSQNTYRRNNSGKKQKNFMLSNEAISSLEKLSKAHDVSKARILEILIEIESSKGGHIDEKLARAKLLKSG